MTDGERDPAEWIFGIRLQAEMDNRGWSARELARRAKELSPDEKGASAQTVANMLVGHKAGKPDEPWRPTQTTIRAIAAALEDSPDEWLRMAGYHVPQRPTTDPDAAVRLAGKIVRIDPGDATALERLVDSLLRSRGWIAADAPGPGPGAGAASQPTEVLSHEGEFTAGPVEDVAQEFVPDEVPAREASDHQGR